MFLKQCCFHLLCDVFTFWPSQKYKGDIKEGKRVLLVRVYIEKRENNMRMVFRGSKRFEDAAERTNCERGEGAWVGGYCYVSNRAPGTDNKRKGCLLYLQSDGSLNHL
jgi:hypothetical protein